MTTTDFSVIDQMFSAVLSQNESKATIDALRHPMRPPCRTRAICPTSPRFYRTLIDGTPYFLRLFRPNWIRTTALRAAMHRPCLVDLPAISPFLVYLREPIPGPHRNQRSVSQIMGSPTQHAKIVLGFLRSL